MSDPKRLLDDTHDSDLAKLLSAGKSETPDQAQLGALAAQLGALGGLGGAGAAGAAGGGGAGGVTSAGVKAGLVMKIGGAVVIASAAGATAVVATSTHETPRAPVGIVATSAVSSNAASGAPSGLQVAAPDEAPIASAPTTRTSAPPPATSASPELEVRLLERAQDALRSRPAEALALADDHARQFPRGMLAQEREVIAVEALVKLNRMGEAKARAARFKARFPGSSHARRIDTLVGEE